MRYVVPIQTVAKQERKLSEKYFNSHTFQKKRNTYRERYTTYNKLTGYDVIINNLISEIMCLLTSLLRIIQH